MEWINNNIPEATLVDLVVLKAKFNAPDEVLDFIRKNWLLQNIKKPFAKSEIYSKMECSYSSLSSSSEQTE